MWLRKMKICAHNTYFEHLPEKLNIIENVLCFQYPCIQTSIQALVLGDEIIYVPKRENIL